MFCCDRKMVSPRFHQTAAEKEGKVRCHRSCSVISEENALTLASVALLLVAVKLYGKITETVTNH